MNSHEIVSGQLRGIKVWLTGLDHVSGTEAGEVVPQTWKDQAFAAVTKGLVSISSVKPVIIVLEDMHWADSASILLLHYIARAVKSQRILVLATFRSEELNFDFDGHPHPISELLRLMKRSELVKEIKLSNLSEIRGWANC